LTRGAAAGKRSLLVDVPAMEGLGPGQCMVTWGLSHASVANGQPIRAALRRVD